MNTFSNESAEPTFTLLQDKRNQKEKDRQETKSQIQTAMSNVETQRDREIKALKEKLERENLQIRDIPSDGNCLYR